MSARELGEGDEAYVRVQRDGYKSFRFFNSDDQEIVSPPADHDRLMEHCEQLDLETGSKVTLKVVEDGGVRVVP